MTFPTDPAAPSRQPTPEAIEQTITAARDYLRDRRSPPPRAHELCVALEHVADRWIAVCAKVAELSAACTSLRQALRDARSGVAAANDAAELQQAPCKDESGCDWMPWCRINNRCHKATMTTVATPEAAQAQQPVAIVMQGDIEEPYHPRIQWTGNALPCGTHLYAASPPAAQEAQPAKDAAR